MEHLVYVLLDHQYKVWIITNALLEKTSAPANTIRLLLSTMLAKDTTSTKMANGLVLKGIHATVTKISLPETYSS